MTQLRPASLVLGLAFIVNILVVVAQDSSSISSNTASITPSTDVSSTTSPTLSRSSAETTSTLPSSIAPSSTNTLPNFNDTAPGGSGTGDGDDSHNYDHDDGLINYYFIFLALILCFAGLAAFFVFKRRRRALLHSSYSRQNALARDINGWGNAGGTPLTWGGRRYWPGSRWRSTEDVGRVEGLNEQGEAPPPYMPKRNEEGRATEITTDGGPAIPLQTFDRGQAAVSKPPDYTQSDVRRASASSDGEPSNARLRASGP